ncbi:MAG TPA: NapC/NirT family cytochrome c [Rhodopseudomonas sp.]|uniref:NapC/NirT family cytochrome c n=1 Tax=Rhodopseudomonas sp. TaxID=1078 RepID=UPI002EDAB31B
MLQKFTRGRRNWTLAAVGVLGMIAGVAAWGGFNTVMDATNSPEFCVSCHEMRDTVYKEYKTSVHYANASGVRATCPDCHVPKQWLPKFVRKIEASAELYHKLIGSIDSPEKFEAERLTLARQVWSTMQATDSRECRNCHSFEAMDFHKQRPAAAQTMPKAMQRGATCIDCHKGIAHKLPDISRGYRALYDGLLKAAKSLQPKPGDTLTTLTTTAFYLDRPSAEDAAAAGTLTAATPVRVIARDGDWLQVEIAGWQQEGSERTFYALQGKRIPAAALGAEAVDKVTRVGSVSDPDTDQLWSEGRLNGWIANANLVADPAALAAYGAEMYEANCALCHALPPPGNYLANQWIGNLNAMKRFVGLDDEQYRLLQKYLQINAKDTGGLR